MLSLLEVIYCTYLSTFVLRAVVELLKNLESRMSFSFNRRETVVLVKIQVKIFP